MDKIKIGYSDYDIIVQSSESPLLVNGDECYGIIEHDNKKIYLNERFNKDQQNETLLHEVIHGIDEFMNIGLTEDQVERLGKGMYLVLKENNLLK